MAINLGKEQEVGCCRFSLQWLSLTLSLSDYACHNPGEDSVFQSPWIWKTAMKMTFKAWKFLPGSLGKFAFEMFALGGSRLYVRNPTNLRPSCCENRESLFSILEREKKRQAGLRYQTCGWRNSFGIRSLGPVAIANVTESEINHPLITFQIPALQNHEQNKTVVLSHYILKYFVIQQ